MAGVWAHPSPTPPHTQCQEVCQTLCTTVTGLEDVFSVYQQFLPFLSWFVWWSKLTWHFCSGVLECKISAQRSSGWERSRLPKFGRLLARQLCREGRGAEGGCSLNELWAGKGKSPGFSVASLILQETSIGSPLKLNFSLLSNSVSSKTTVIDPSDLILGFKGAHKP